MTERRKTTPDTDAKKRQERIGDHLRKLYDDVANEPIPDEFMKLLEDADNTSDDESEGE